MDESLKHAGVLGMRWGFRRGPSPSNPSSDHETVSKIKKKRVSELSNQEIQTLLNRSLLEKQYRDLNPSKIAAGKKIVTNILVKAATTEGQKYVDKNLPIWLSKAATLLKTIRP